LKLLLLVCQKANPKELLLAVEQSLERLLVATPDSLDEEEAIERISRFAAALSTSDG
jgi:hypothetical protein